MPSTNKRKRTAGKMGYVEGSAARQLHAVPQQKPRKNPTRGTEGQKKKEYRPVRRTRTLPMNAGTVFIFAAAVIATLFICVQYVELQSEITYRLKRINAMETELADLRMQNDELEKRIAGYVDLNYIYQVATEELGMRYAARNQISTYKNSGSEYVRQYEDIPESSSDNGILP